MHALKTEGHDAIFVAYGANSDDKFDIMTTLGFPRISMANVTHPRVNDHRVFALIPRTKTNTGSALKTTK